MNSSSIWLPASQVGTFLPLSTNHTVDVVIIGGGITGLTLAQRLKEVGRTVAVIEMQCIGMGATGSSTGHLTSALDIDYASLQTKFGQGGAQEAARKSEAAIDHIESLVDSLAIACDFHRADGWRYTEETSGEAGLVAESEVARRFGLAVEVVDGGPLPFMRRSLRFRNQAMFDPVRYVRALANHVHGDGSYVFEKTRVEEVDGGEPNVVHAGGFTVTARHVVHATHTPIGVVLPLQLEVAPYTSYVIGVRLSGRVPPDLYWDTANPYHYIRPVHTEPDGAVLLIGGEDHKTAHESDGAARFAALESYARARFAVTDVAWRWAGELFQSVDGLPYFGRLGGQTSIHGATGFAGTGLTMGTAAALDIGRIILGGDPSLSEMRPQRFKPVAAAASFLRENASAAWHMIADRLDGPSATPVLEIPLGEGRVTMVEGRQVAVYRSPTGQVHHLSPVCPHVGGIVKWNQAGASWDCPLHGSRFSPDGSVLAGPACEGLQRMRSKPDSGSEPEGAYGGALG